MPRILNIYKDDIPSDAVYIGRAGKGKDGYFGNPYRIGPDGDRGEVYGKYRGYFAEKIQIDPEFRRRVEELKGKDLVCFCAPNICHGDIILEWVNDDNTTTP